MSVHAVATCNHVQNVNAIVVMRDNKQPICKSYIVVQNLRQQTTNLHINTVLKNVRQQTTNLQILHCCAKFQTTNNKLTLLYKISDTTLNGREVSFINKRDISGLTKQELVNDTGNDENRDEGKEIGKNP